MSYLEIIIYMIVVRCAVHFKEQGYENVYQNFPRLKMLEKRLSRSVLESWARDESEEKARYMWVMELIGDTKEPDHVLQSVLDLCLTQMYLPEFAAFLKYFTGASVTLWLAYELEGKRFPAYTDIRRKLERLSYICNIDWEKTPLAHEELQMDDRVMGYLMGDMPTNMREEQWFWMFDARAGLHPLFVFEDLAEKGVKHLQDEGGILQLSGAGGRRFLARHISARLGKDMIFVEFAKLGSCENPRFRQRRLELIREALFCQGGICIYGISENVLKELSVDTKDLTRQLMLPIRRRRIPLLLCTEKDMQVWNYDESEEGQGVFGKLLRLELPKGDYFIREKVWEGFSQMYGMKLESAQFAERYQLSPSEIARVLTVWRERYPEGWEQMDIKMKLEFSRLCYDTVCKGVEGRIGNVVYPEISMEELKVTDEVQELLDQVIASVEGSHMIYEEWQMKKKYPYGRAVTVLLTGPPGTGKTMSAHALASRLQIPLYQVNLSNVVDKYIGETEKHLEQAFSFAEKTSMILFFDEADSLFGKRSEVTDARDKYANMEVSYLLQRIEQFDGIVIMATNFLNNMDPAFLRRIKYVIQFQQPDEKQRRQIWESCMPGKLPAEDIDLEYLAHQFDFSGGTIKNVLLNACAVAVKEKDILRMEYILKAIRNEYTKTGRISDQTTWGEYAYLFM